MLDSPVLTNSEFEAMERYMDETVARIHCVFEPSDTPEDGVDRAVAGRWSGSAARPKTRSAPDCEHIVLTDGTVRADQAPIPMILATGAVHSHLIRQKLRTFVSLNVRSGECLDVHYFAILIGVGATTVNAYLAQDSIAERQTRGLFGDLRPGRLSETLQKGGRRWPLEGHVEDGDLGPGLLSRRQLQLRGGRPQPGPWSTSSSQGCRAGISGIGLTGIQQKVLSRAPTRLEQRFPGASGWRAVPAIGAVANRTPGKPG